MVSSPRIFTFTDDFVFKYIFGRESNEPLLAKLLNALLHRTGDRQIANLQLLNPFNPKETATSKASVVDVKAQDLAGSRFLIEVQVKSRPDQVARTLFYLSRLFVEQLGAGHAYSELCQATAVTLLGHRIFRNTRVQSIFRFREVEQGFELGDQLEIHFVELPKVAEFLASRHPEAFLPRSTPPWGLLSRFEKWLYILRYGKRFAAGQALPESFTREEGIDMAVNELQKINADRELRQLLEQQEKEAHELASLQENARRAGMAKGMAIGMEKGVEKGRVEGHKEGRQEGHKEGRADGLGEAVRQLVASGMTPDEVATRLQLSPPEVTKALNSPTAPSKTA